MPLEAHPTFGKSIVNRSCANNFEILANNRSSSILSVKTDRISFINFFLDDIYRTSSYFVARLVEPAFFATRIRTVTLVSGFTARIF